MLDTAFKTNLALNKTVTANAWRGESDLYAAKNVVDGNKETYWATDDAITTGSLEIDLNETQPVKYVVIQEYIPLGQRVKSFTVEAQINGTWQPVVEATTIGYKRILKLNAVETNKIRINITAAKACPIISNVAIY